MKTETHPAVFHRSTSTPRRVGRASVVAGVALGLVLAGLPAQASAEPSVKDQVAELNEQAVEKFKAKEYDEAVRLMEEAYDLKPEPNYLFNIGRIYEESGNLEKAVEFYERFVKEPGVSLEAREKGLERLRVLRAIIEETKAREEPEPVIEDEPEPVIEDEPEPEPEDEPEPEEEPEPEPRGPKKMRAAGFALLGTGGASLAAAGVLAGLAYSRANSLEDQHTFETRDETVTQGRAMALSADILFGVGGALAVTGLVLVIVAAKRKPGQEEAVAARPRLSPFATRGGGGMAATLRF